ncbi:hypothetical protein SAMN04488239_1389 [Ruegeria marina]|uniref:Uncharacterized protein n=1 Tax=Ruegeria marina TaxID=639004 RepID=A0A1G7FNW3_9RHOB|nr:hypothetical protein SAMN04488239_1389 [Ruegeria marina]
MMPILYFAGIAAILFFAVYVRIVDLKGLYEHAVNSSWITTNTIRDFALSPKLGSRERHCASWKATTWKGCLIRRCRSM